MAKTRLTMDIRDSLVRFARRSAEAAYDRTKEDTMQAEAEILVKALVEEKFPPRDMKVLTKYEVAQADSCIRLINDGGGVFVFNFTDDSKAPVVPTRYRSSRGFHATAEIIRLHGEIEKLSERREREIAGLVGDYRAAVTSARYAEDVKEIWPASAEILDPFIERRGNAVVVADPDVLRRVQSTNLGQAA